MITYLYCEKCNGSVLIDLSESILFLTNFGINKNRLAVSMGNIDFIKEVFKPKFYCPSCREYVNDENIIGKCFHCGNTFKTDELYSPSISGGLYCEKCLKYFGEEVFKPLSKIMEKVSIK